MIRLMMLIETESTRRVEVVLLADVFPDPDEAEYYVCSGEGGVAELPLWDGRTFRVWRDQVWGICGWEEG